MDAVETFELTVQRGAADWGDGWPVVAEYAAGGGLPARAEGTLRLDPATLRPHALDARAYGEVLGRALFVEEVRDAFQRALPAGGGPLRVLLCVEASELRPLRWERLCAPMGPAGGPDGGWAFLGLDQRAPLSLYLPSLTDRRFPPIGRRDLRALVVVASPAGLDAYRLVPFDAPAAAAAVRAGLGEAIPCDVLGPEVVGGVVGPPTLDALCARLTAAPDGPYTLLHVVCHGQYLTQRPSDAAGAAAGDTVLYLADGAGSVDPITGTVLLRRLGGLGGRHGLPRLVFLAACESAHPEAEGPSGLGGLAQRLVRELGTPAAVAMTEPVAVALAEGLTGAFYRQLRAHGQPDLALAEARAALAGRTDATVPALFSRLGGRLLFDDAHDRPLTPAEVGDGLSRLEALLPERAPVLLETLRAPGGPAAVLQGGTATDPGALSPEARQAREDALHAVDALSLEALDLAFNALARGQSPPPYDAHCPFRGLEPFRPEDRAFFFGREALVETLRQRLAAHPFLAVLGPSGSGKSSVVLAGLLPALQRQEPGLRVAYVRPGAAPLDALAAALAAPQAPAAGGVPTAAGPGEGAAGDAAVVVVDQFEEAFTLCRDEAQRRGFLDELLALAATRRVVLTMRADFWGECAPYSALRAAMQAHQELIAPMDAAELRRAMERQAAAAGPPGGLRFEADLAQTILEDVQGEPGAMPLLQHALLELWTRRHGRWLRAAAYRDLGGVREAIAHTADGVVAGLPPEERDRVRDVFLRLTRLDEAADAAARRDTRRRVPETELVPPGAPPEATKALVAKLADARLVVTAGGEVEVAHEALIRHWGRLRQWLDEDRAFLLWRQRLGAALAEWERNGRDAGALLRGAALADGERWLAARPDALNAVERRYVRASIALREGLRQKIVLGALAVAVVGLVLAGLAGWQWREAEQQRVRAERRFADVRHLATSFLFEFHDAIANLPGATPARQLIVERALKYLDGLAQEAEGDLALQRELAFAYLRVSDVQSNRFSANLGDTAGALESSRRALAILERLARADPTNARALRELAVGHGRMGDLQLATREVAGALESYRRALAIDERLARADPTNAEAQRALAASHLKMGDVQWAAREVAGALESYRRALDIFERQAQADPTNARALRDLSHGHGRMGDLQLATREVAGALESYRRALDIDERLARADPTNARALRDLAVSYSKMGDVQSAAREVAGALESYRRALDIDERLARADPTNAQVQRDLAVGYSKMGDVQWAAREVAGALESYRRALDIFERQAQASPTNAEALRDLEFVRRMVAELESVPR